MQEESDDRQILCSRCNHETAAQNVIVLMTAAHFGHHDTTPGGWLDLWPRERVCRNCLSDKERGAVREIVDTWEASRS